MKPAPVDGGRFKALHPPKTLADVLRWQLSFQRQRWPRRVENREFPQPPQRVDGTRIACTWVGQSTFLIQTAGLNILTDPFFSTRASPFAFAGPKRVRPPGLALANLPPIDAVLVSHNHYDHLDRRSLRALAGMHDAHFLMPIANARHARGVVPAAAITELDWGQSVEFERAKFTAMPAAHWSRRSMRDTNRSLWAGFMIESAAGNIFFAGDTGYGEGATFRNIRSHFGTPRLSLLPIGAYEPRWFMRDQHMNPDDAIRAHLDLGSELSLAMHHSTIQLTDEAIDQPVQDLAAAAMKHGVDPARFLVPDVGETIFLG